VSAAVVICAYPEERWDELVSAVASVRAQRLPARELVVVVDSNAPSAELAATQVVENCHAPGNSGARDTGVGATNAPVLAPSTTTRRRRALAVGAAIGVEEGTLGAGDPVLAHWREEHPRWFTDEFTCVVGARGRYRGPRRRNSQFGRGQPLGAPGP
jgi:glucosyl-dolichyl phosphate glucuronosyltransferase